MEPRICIGDIVIFRKQNIVENGDLALISIKHNSAIIQRVIIHENGISLISFNNTFQPLFFSNDEIRTLPVEILGKAIENRAKL